MQHGAAVLGEGGRVEDGRGIGRRIGRGIGRRIGRIAEGDDRIEEARGRGCGTVDGGRQS